jgi:glycosyltransferase involved in cell wall biosynthesis
MNSRSFADSDSTKPDVDRLPLVTVITPAYNRASFLQETIASVLGQDYPRLEYIVLDDGSTDETPHLLETYSGMISWVSHPNMGETRTVNKGFLMATGDIIGVVNSDDPLLPGAIARIVEYFMRDRELLVAYPDWEMIDATGAVVQSVTTHDYSYLDMVRWHHCIPGPGTFFRRKVIDSIGGRDTQFRYVADFDFWIRAGLFGTFARVPEKLATFRQHPDSASVSHKGKAMAEEHISLVKRLYAQPGLPESVVKVRREAYSSAHFVAGCVCGSDFPLSRKMHFIAAVFLAPVKYIGEYRRERTFYMFPVLMRVMHFLFGWSTRFVSKLPGEERI